jgi:CelD/BcsL family acetyltransferase involved in cellulose biosynthesis
VTQPGARRKAEVEAEIEPLREQWDELADRLDAPPFARPGWIGTFWRAFGRGRLLVLATRRDGRLTGVLPLTRRTGMLDAPANYHTPFFGPLAEDNTAATELAEQVLAYRSRRVALPFTLANDQATDALAAALASGGRHVAQEVQQRTPVVDLEHAGDWPAYEETLSRGLRKELRRHQRRLEDLDTVTLEVVTQPEALRERLPEALEVEASGWKRDRGTAILSRADTRVFYEEISRWAAGRGIARLYLLRLGQTTIAVDLTLEDAGVRYMLKGGFVAEYRRYGPGMLLLGKGLEEALSRGVRRVELGGGPDPYKLRWTDQTRDRVLVQAFSRSPLGVASRLANTVGRPAAHRLRGRLARNP